MILVFDQNSSNPCSPVKVISSETYLQLDYFKKSYAEITLGHLNESSLKIIFFIICLRNCDSLSKQRYRTMHLTPYVGQSPADPAAFLLLYHRTY